MIDLLRNNYFVFLYFRARGRENWKLEKYEKKKKSRRRNY
jgi:hypothetical protein